MHTLFKNSSLYVLAEFVSIGVSLIMFPVYTRYLSPSDYGVLGVLLLTQSFVIPFASLQLHHSIRRFYFDFQDKYLNEYISTIFFTIILTSLIVITILSFLFPIYFEDIFELDVFYIDYFTCYIAMSFLVILVNFCKYILRSEQSSHKYFYLTIFSCFISTILMIIEVVINNHGLTGAVRAGIYSNIIITIFFLFTIRKYIIFKFNFLYLYDSFKFSLPIIPHSLSTIIFLYSDRFILEKYVSLSALGLFFAADRIASSFKNIINQINSAIQPYFFKKLSFVNYDVKKEIYSTYTLFFLIYLSVLIPVTILIKPIIHIVLGDSYFDCALMIPLLASCYLLRILYCYFSTFIVFEKKTILLTKASIFSGITNIVLNIIFIPHYGIYAAIYTTIASFGILLLFSFYYCSKIKIIPFEKFFFISCFFYYFLIFFISNNIIYIIPDPTYIAFTRLFLIVFSFILFYKPLIKSFRHVYNS